MQHFISFDILQYNVTNLCIDKGKPEQLLKFIYRLISQLDNQKLKLSAQFSEMIRTIYTVIHNILKP